MGRSGVRSAHENLERELVAERAAALGRIGERLACRRRRRRAR